MSYSRLLILLSWITVTILATPVSRCYAMTIAVLPVEDLSQGDNGLNLAITRTLEELLADKGFNVSSQAEVITFMVKNRVRRLGVLSSPYIYRLHTELQVDYILLASISQQRTAPPFALNLNLQLIRTKDARIIWAKTTEQSDVNRVSILALSTLRDKAEIEYQVASDALSTIPINTEQELPIIPQARIEYVQLSPQIVKPGEKVNCQIKLGATTTDQTETTVSIFVGEQIIEAQYDSQASAFMASWLSESNNKQYTVTATVSADNQESREVIIGKYQVDSQPPLLKLRVRGQELNGLVILQKKVRIIPALQSPEPISRWQLTVHNAEGRQLVNETGSKTLPPQFTWWGQEQNGTQVKDGIYAIELSIWDRAGNWASSQESIKVFRKKPEMTIAMKKQPHTLAVALNYYGEIPLAYWRLQVRDKTGTILAERSGSEESNKIILPLKMASQKSLKYRVYAQDMLGNYIQKDLTPKTNKKIKSNDEEKDEDDGNFLASVGDKKIAGEEVWAEDF